VICNAVYNVRMRLRIGIALALTSLAGCAQLLGIDQTSGTTAPAPYTLRITQVFDGATVVDQPLDLTGQSATWYVLDATTGTLDPYPGAIVDGAWTVQLPAEPVIVEYTAPDVPTPTPHILAVTARDLVVREFFYGDPSPAPAPAGASFMLDVTLPTAIAAGETFRLIAAGAWTTHDLVSGSEVPAMGSTITSTVPYASFADIVGYTVPAITAADDVLLLRYVAGQLTGILAVPAFDQVATPPQPVTGAMTAVAADQTFTAAISPMTDSARYAAAQPAMTSFQVGWEVDAATGPNTTSGIGITLVNGTPQLTDTAITASYGNPFTTAPNWPVLVDYNTTTYRTYMIGMTTPVGFAAGLYTYTNDAAGQTLDLPAGLPTLVSLDKQALASDGMTITLPSGQPVELGFTADRTANSSYVFQIGEITVGGSGAVRTPIADAWSSTPDIVVPPALFVSGHSYVVRAVCLSGGLPNVASGDYLTSMYPVSIGYLDSALFTVN